MDKQMDEWIARVKTVGQSGCQTDRQSKNMLGRTSFQSVSRLDSWSDGWSDKKMGRWTDAKNKIDGETDRQVDGRTGRQEMGIWTHSTRAHGRANLRTRARTQTYTLMHKGVVDRLAGRRVEGPEDRLDGTRT